MEQQQTGFGVMPVLAAKKEALSKAYRHARLQELYPCSSSLAHKMRHIWQ
jgi:hypothetical protein